MTAKTYLKAHHDTLNEYIASRSWRSLMANEVVEKSIRSLPVGYAFDTSGYRNVFLGCVPYFAISFCLIVITGPLLLVAYFAFFLRRDQKKFIGGSMFFLRNKLSLNRYISLQNSGLLDADSISIVYDDSLGFSPTNVTSKKVSLSSYLPANPFLFLKDLIFELAAVLHDCIVNAPEISLVDIYACLKRLPHFIFVKVCVEQILKENSVSRISSFEMISRYASLLQSICREFKVREAIGYPHGLEYDIYYPNGVFGSRVFVTSESTAKKLYSKYENKVFEVNGEVLRSLFVVPTVRKNEVKCVYFTDSRNPQLDFENLVELKRAIDFLKLHPADRKSFYDSLGVSYIDDLSEAFSYGKGIMRSSTVVFEGMLSGCDIHCLCTNDEEEYAANYLYPTIAASSVTKIYTLSQVVAED